MNGNLTFGRDSVSAGWRREMRLTFVPDPLKELSEDLVDLLSSQLG